VALYLFEGAIGLASRDVDSSGGFAGLAGAVFGDRASMLACRGRYGDDALRATSVRATLLVGQAVVVVLTLERAIRRVRYQVWTLTALDGEACWHRGTVFVHGAVYVGHYANFVGLAADVLAWFVALTPLATARIHLVAVRAVEIAIERLAVLRLFPDQLTVGGRIRS